MLRRDEARRAAEAGEAPRALTETDFLLRSDDGTRQGAVGFHEGPGSAFVASGGGSRVPPVRELPRLLDAARRVDSRSDEDCAGPRVLPAPGSALGGARPRASVRERDGAPALAKFPRERDEWEIPRWEAVALSLAVQAGVRAARGRLEEAGGGGVLVLRRFDRAGRRRVPFLSALTMVGAADHEPRPYTEIAEAVRRRGADPLGDLAELRRRIVFTVVISNSDDHLRNHGFLRAPGGWRLSPASDLNGSREFAGSSPAATVPGRFEVAESLGASGEGRFRVHHPTPLKAILFVRWFLRGQVSTGIRSRWVENAETPRRGGASRASFPSLRRGPGHPGGMPWEPRPPRRLRRGPERTTLREESRR